MGRDRCLADALDHAQASIAASDDATAILTRTAVALTGSTRSRQLSFSAKSCANPHMVSVGFHDADVGNNPPPVT